MDNNLNNLVGRISDLVIISSASGRYQPFVAVDSQKVFAQAMKEAMPGTRLIGSASSSNDQELVKELRDMGVRVVVSKK